MPVKERLISHTNRDSPPGNEIQTVEKRFQRGHIIIICLSLSELKNVDLGVNLFLRTL